MNNDPFLFLPWVVVIDRFLHYCEQSISRLNSFAVPRMGRAPDEGLSDHLRGNRRPRKSRGQQSVLLQRQGGCHRRRLPQEGLDDGTSRN